jgi:hypothetical protein
MKRYPCDDNIDFCQYYNFQEPYSTLYREDYYNDESAGYIGDIPIFDENVTEIMNLIETGYANLYQLLISRGMSQGGTEYLFRYIVYFTIINAERFPGSEMQRAYAIFSALRSLEPWIFSSFASTYLPPYTIDSIIMTIIMFTLRKISTPE